MIGTGQEVYYYDYNGQLLFQSILPQDASWKTFGHMAYYDNHLWATIDLVNSENKQAPTVEQWLYKFDLGFNEVEKRKLDVADLGRMDINYKTGSEIAVKDGHVLCTGSLLTAGPYPERHALSHQLQPVGYHGELCKNSSFTDWDTFFSLNTLRSYPAGT